MLQSAFDLISDASRGRSVVMRWSARFNCCCLQEISSRWHADAMCIRIPQCCSPISVS